MLKTKKSPLISIIIPVYKVEKYLDRCVESIVNQVFKNVEIILVDDGSPDNCPKMCDYWAKKDNRIKVIHKANGGVSSARNEGLKLATGEWVSFSDSDDYYTDKFSSIEFYINKAQDADVISCGFVKNNKTYNVFKDIFINPQNEKEILYAIKNDLSISCWTKIIRRTFLIKNNIYFPTGAKSEDFAWSYDLLLKSKKQYLTPLCYYVYVDNVESVTHNFKLEFSKDQFRNIRRVKDMFDKIENFKKYRSKIYSHLFKTVIYNFYQVYKFADRNDFKQLFNENKDLLVAPKKLKHFIFYVYLKLFY